MGLEAVAVEAVAEVAEEHHHQGLEKQDMKRLSLHMCTTNYMARVLTSLQETNRRPDVKKQPSQDVLHGDTAEKELGLARLVSSYTLPHQNSQPGKRGRQTACSKVLSRRARET